MNQCHVWKYNQSATTWKDLGFELGFRNLVTLKTVKREGRWYFCTNFKSNDRHFLLYIYLTVHLIEIVLFGAYSIATLSLHPFVRSSFIESWMKSLSNDRGSCVKNSYSLQFVYVFNLKIICICTRLWFRNLKIENFVYFKKSETDSFCLDGAYPSLV
mgnify:FL=1